MLPPQPLAIAVLTNFYNVIVIIIIANIMIIMITMIVINIIIVIIILTTFQTETYLFLSETYQKALQGHRSPCVPSGRCFDLTQIDY